MGFELLGDLGCLTSYSYFYNNLKCIRVLYAPRDDEGINQLQPELILLMFSGLALS